MSTPVEDRFITNESQRLDKIRQQMKLVEGSSEELQSDISNENLLAAASVWAAPVMTLLGMVGEKGLGTVAEYLFPNHPAIQGVAKLVGGLAGGFASDPNVASLFSGKTPKEIEEALSTQEVRSKLTGYAVESRTRMQKVAEGALNAKGVKEVEQKLTGLQRAYQATGNIYKAQVHSMLMNPRIPAQKLLTDVLNLPVQAVFKGVGVASEVHSLSAGAKATLSALNAYRTTFKDAMQIAFKTWKLGEPEFMKVLGINDKSLAYSFDSAWDNSPISYKYRLIKAAGDTWSAGSRAILSADQFAKALAYSGELRLNGFKDGLEEAERRGLIGAAKLHFADIWSEKLFADSPDWLHAKALEGMFQTTFTSNGPIIRALNTMRSIPGARIAIPFFRTPANLFKAGLEISPLNFSWLWKGGLDQSTAMAKQMLGSAIYYELAEQTMRGNITGDGPQGKGRELWPGYKHPRSIRIGGQWISYAHLGPFATIISLAADSAEMYHASKEPDGDTRLIDTVGEVIAQQATHAPFLSEISNLSHVLDSWKRGGAGKAGEEWLARTITGFIPSVIREYAQVEDPVVKKAENLRDMIAENIPGWSKTVPPKTNIYGYNQYYAGAYDSNGNVSKLHYLANQINPLPIYPDLQIDDVDRELYRHGYEPNKPPEGFKGTDPSIPTVQLSKQQQYDWSINTGHATTIGGKNLHARWSDIINSDFYQRATPALQKQLLENIYHGYYELGKMQMINKPIVDSTGNVSYPNRNILQQQIQQKVLENTGSQLPNLPQLQGPAGQ